jgi:hypothetical protein
MALMTRTQLSTTVLPATAPTPAELLQGKQPGSTQQLSVYSILAAFEVSTTERIEFKFEGGVTQTYSQAQYQYMTDVNGDEYFYGSVCVKMDKNRATGTFPDWVYAISRTPDTQLLNAFTV